MNLNFPKQEITISLDEKIITWLKTHSRKDDMSIDNIIRRAIVTLDLMDETPGAWEAVNRIRDAQLPPKYEPFKE